MSNIAEIAQELVEEGQASVEEVVDVALQTTKNNPILLAGVALVSLSVGAFIGYKVAEKRLEPKYAALADQEIKDAKEIFSALNKTDDYSSPEKAVEKLIPENERFTPKQVERLDAAIKALESYSPESTKVEVDAKSITVTTTVESENEDGPVEQMNVTSNIFVDGEPLNEDDYDYDYEVSQRSEDFPYVITEEEFFENEGEFIQPSFTYYEGDDILTDEKDQIVTDVESTVGEENLKKFGHMSKDNNLVYIRNNKRGYDYEVAKHKGTYQETVLGVIQHSDDRRAPMRFRGGDD